MLLITFDISNPFVKRYKSQWRTIRVSKNKTLDLEFVKDNTIISFYLRWAIRENHAGITINAGLLGYSIGFEFSDNRHWVNKNGTWERIE